MRTQVHAMGTVISIQWQPPTTFTSTPDVSALVERNFAELECDFSLYRPESELSRVANRSLRLEDSSPVIRSMYSTALGWRSATSGAFTPHRPDGIIDLNGIVKAIAIERSGRALDAAGIYDWSVNAGGDILCSARGAARSMGVANPNDRDRLLCAVVMKGGRRAMATSGSAERGDHIWSRERSAHPSFAQVTVMANDIVTADVLATAIVSGGHDTLDDVTQDWDIDVLTVEVGGALKTTPGFRAALADGRYRAAG